MPDFHDFPPDFLNRAAALLGDELGPFLESLAAPAPGLRVNTLRLPPEHFRAISSFELEPLPFPGEGFLVRGEARPGTHPHHDAGLYYLQDPGAMAVGALVDPRPGEKVLDLAAAPGGKATHLAARMQGRGLLVANDVSRARARQLGANLERSGVTNAVVLSETADRLADRFGPFFDRVLLDAPCSGESMFHKSDAARSDWSPAAVRGCARRQEGLIVEAARLVRPGGLLFYSTCTFAPEENEGVISAFLAGHGEFDLVELAPVPGGAPGRGDWVEGGDGGRELSTTLRLWPHRTPGAGHFVAALRKSGGEEDPAPPSEDAAVPREAREHFDAFRAASLTLGPIEEGLSLRGAELYQLPSGTPELRGLRVLRPGWWLGTLARNRFEPSHSLALGLRAGEARRTVDLEADGPDVDAFLRGETLRLAGEPGWVLVTVDGFPLGWGKRVGSTVKNHYPKGLRRRG